VELFGIGGSWRTEADDHATRGKTMNRIIKLGCLIGFARTIATPAFAGEETVTLMLGGKFCGAYLKDVRDALMNVDGVKAVDLKSIKGHAVVIVDSAKVKPEQLATAVSRVKGESWYCTGEIMR
jgi:periplasmic mercuric ion binding protein